VTLHDGLVDVQVVDLDRDGVLDLIGGVKVPATLVALRMAGDGPIGTPVATSLFIYAMSNGIVPADTDGDGLLDFVVSSADTADTVVIRNAMGPFIGVGHSLASAQGTPVLQLIGTPAAGGVLIVDIQPPLPPAAGFLFVGLKPVNLPFGGGIFLPDALVALPLGSIPVLAGFWPASIPPATLLYMQAWYAVSGGGFAASDGWVVVSE
jgi:hypothetical protein